MRTEYLPTLGSLPLASIRRVHIQKITDDMASRGLSVKTIRKYHSQIATVFGEALRLEMIPSSPCDRIRFPKQIKVNEIRVFTRVQALIFLEIARLGVTVYYPETVRSNGRKLPAHSETVGGNFMLYLMFNLALNSGMRRGELCGLTWKNVNFRKNQITIVESASKAKSKNGFFLKEPKTASSARTITIPKSVMDELQQWKLLQNDIRKQLGTAWNGAAKPENQLVFTAQDGSGMDLNYPVRYMHRLITAYNGTVSESEQLPNLDLHELRHSHATLLLEAGVPISEISRRLGHVDIYITLSTYAHWLPENDKKASDAIAQVFSNQPDSETANNWNEFGTKRDATERNVTQRS